jgi:hypothetical protein
MEAQIADLSHYVGTALYFHWYHFQHQNLLAEAELKRRRQHNLTYQILDGYDVNGLRPDKHTDCLHSCCPGKMDVFPQLILHYLRGDRTAWTRRASGPCSTSTNGTSMSPPTPR